MKLIRNTGADRVIDLLRPQLTAGRQCDVVTSTVSLSAFAELLHELAALVRCRLVLPPAGADLAILGSAADRAARNRLQTRWLARRLARWLENKAEVRRAVGAVPQGAFVLRDGAARPLQVLLGPLAFSTEGLGLTPGNPLNLIEETLQVSAIESHAEALEEIDIEDVDLDDPAFESLLVGRKVKVLLMQARAKNALWPACSPPAAPTP
jgi:hypothetical protein